jgi:hypothetical protein
MLMRVATKLQHDYFWNFCRENSKSTLKNFGCEVFVRKITEDDDVEME